MQITKNLPMEEYLALPAVSASVLKLMVEDCPAAAWHESWLNPNRESDDTKESDAGTIAHSILLEGHAGNVKVFEPSDYPNEKGGGVATGWTNKAIRAQRDIARASGLIPVLAEDFGAIEAMVASVRRYIESLKNSEPAIWAAFQPGGGESEVTVQWDHALGEQLVKCRIRPDRISTDRKLIVDVKTTAGSANPEAWSRAQMVAMGGYISAAFYRMGIEAAFEESPEYVFLVVEQKPPYLCSLVGCDPHAMELGREKALAGLDLWARCVAAQRWPAYPARVVYPEIAPWVEAQWIERQGGYQYDYEAMFKKEAA